MKEDNNSKSRMTQSVKTARSHALAIIKGVVLITLRQRLHFDDEGRRVSDIDEASIGWIDLNSYRSLSDIFISQARDTFNSISRDAKTSLEVLSSAAQVLSDIPRMIDFEFENPVTKALILEDIKASLSVPACYGNYISAECLQCVCDCELACGAETQFTTC